MQHSFGVHDAPEHSIGVTLYFGTKESSAQSLGWHMTGDFSCSFVVVVGISVVGVVVTRVVVTRVVVVLVVVGIVVADVTARAAFGSMVVSCCLESDCVCLSSLHANLPSAYVRLAPVPGFPHWLNHEAPLAQQLTTFVSGFVAHLGQ